MLNICYFILQLYAGDADRNTLAVTSDILYGFYARDTVKMCSSLFSIQPNYRHRKQYKVCITDFTTDI